MHGCTPTHTQPLRVWEALCQTRVPIQHHADGLGLKLWLCNRLMLTGFYRLLRTPELAKAFICIVLCVASMQFSKVALWEMFFWEYGPCVKISANLFVAIFYFARRDSRFTEDRWIIIILSRLYICCNDSCGILFPFYLAFTAMPLKNYGDASSQTQDANALVLRPVERMIEKDWHSLWKVCRWMWCHFPRWSFIFHFLMQTSCEELEPCMKVNLIRDNPLAAMKMADDEFKDRKMLGCHLVISRLRFQCVSICFRYF